MNLTVKEQLSKLLATENINVEHSNVSTASFNLKNRTLTLPNWSDSVSNDVYDLLISHEVGHALYTPVNETLKIFSDEKYPNIKIFINVVEDSRIERMIKDTYPGLKKNYHNGYRELYDQDFFKLTDVDINELPLIDKLNLNEKIGNFTVINFNDDEKVFVDRIKNTKTFEDVVILSKELYNYSKYEQYLDDLKNQISLLVEEINDLDDSEQIDSDDFSDSPKISEDTLKKSEEYKREIEQIKREIETLENNKTPQNNKNFNDFKPTAKTQENLENSVNNISTENQRKIYVQFPEFDYQKFILDNNHVIRLIKNNSKYSERKYLIQMKKEVKKSVEYMIKIFESKKAASFYVRNKLSKTGIINTAKLFSYKFNDDIFKKINIVPEGKNHGMVILLDWSGSMAETTKLVECFKQVLSTVLFCKKMNIPFKVFLFGCEVINTYRFYDYFIKHKIYDIKTYESHYQIVEILNSEMNKNDFNLVLEYFASCSNTLRIDSFNFGGTPLTEACHTIDYVIENFKQTHKIEICNLIVVTDGINNEINAYASDKYHNYFMDDEIIMIRDNKTKKLYKADDRTVGMLTAKLNMIRDKHNCNIIGFFLGESYDISGIIYKYAKNSESDTIKKQLKTKSCATIFNCGYQEYHIVNVKEIKNDIIINDAKTTRGLTSSFNKFLKKKNLNKLVLSKFTETISKQVV